VPALHLVLLSLLEERMNVMKLRLLNHSIIVLVVFSACVVLFGAQKVSSVSPAEQLRAVNLARLINTAEMEFRAKTGKFGIWNQLLDSGVLESVKARTDRTLHLGNVTLARKSEVVSNLNVRLSLGTDGLSYDLTIKDLADQDCDFSIFSNEDGIVYHAKQIECPLD
jgi:hypothetical protein